MKIICFHNPEEENGYLSNWYMSEFCIDEIHFTSMEQYMMYKKAMLFHDMKIASKILQTSDVAQIKQLGRAVSGYDENYWNGVRQIVVYQGLMAKFSQNEKLKDLLLSTGDSILAECAVKDRIWGIGLSMKDADRLDKAKWKGQNLLGYALMLVRERLQAKAWEQRKLGEVFKEYSEKNHIELPALTIIQGGGTVKRDESDRNLMYDKSNLSSYKMVKKDDFIVHLRSFEGGLEKASMDGIVSPAYHTFQGENVDSRFYYPYFRSHEFIKKKLIPHVYGIRDGRSIDIEGMKTIEIPYISLREQQLIGNYLDCIDNLITFHQRKHENIKNTKMILKVENYR